MSDIHVTVTWHDPVNAPRDLLLVAEAVLPGHPDKLADAIADAIVDAAVARDDRAIVQVEVALHDHRCHVNGRVATHERAMTREEVEAIVRATYMKCGYGVPFPGCGAELDWQCPRPEDVEIDFAVQLEVSDPQERAEREYADDQAICIGYACSDPAADWLPVEHWLVLRLRDALWELCQGDRTLGAGPDGELLLTLRGEPLGRVRLEGLVCSVQHLRATSLVRLDREVRGALWARLEWANERLGGRLDLSAGPGIVRVNPSGIFTVGGPINDNGQTGRKSVMDFYGPRVPIGGGALSGKDPWRVDVRGASEARHTAITASASTGTEAHVMIAFWPMRIIASCRNSGKRY